MFYIAKKRKILVIVKPFVKILKIFESIYTICNFVIVWLFWNNFVWTTLFGPLKYQKSVKSAGNEDHQINPGKFLYSRSLGIRILDIRSKAIVIPSVK